jgi:glycosyltransferase involved in cell wall biosynthesis
VIVTQIGNAPTGQGGIAAAVAGHALRRSPGVRIEVRPSYDPGGRSFLRRNRPAGTVLWWLLRARPSGGHVLHLHLAQKGSYVREGSLLWLARLRGHRTVVVSLHASSLSTASAAELRFLARLLRPARTVHVLGRNYRELLTDAGCTRDIVVLPNDVHVPRSVPPLSERPKVVAFHGEIGDRKGVDLLLDVWDSLRPPGWLLQLRGPLHRENGAHLAARAGGMVGVELLGEQSRAVARAALLRSRVLVLPSRAENFPMAICEGLAAGCLVVASDAGAVPELLRSTPSRCFRTGDPKALEDALVRAMTDAVTHDGELEASRNHDRAGAELAVDVLTERWVQVYREACAS